MIVLSQISFLLKNFEGIRIFELSWVGGWCMKIEQGYD